MNPQIITRKIYKNTKAGNIFSSLTLDYFLNGKKVNRFQCERHLTIEQKNNLVTFLNVKKAWDMMTLGKKCDFKTRLDANHKIKMIRELGSDIEQVALQILEDRQADVTFITEVS